MAVSGRLTRTSVLPRARGAARLWHKMRRRKPCGGASTYLQAIRTTHQRQQQHRGAVWLPLPAENARMRNGRAGWFVAIAFWCGCALLVAAGPDRDVWVRAVIWTGLALLFVATLRWWRPGVTVHLPARIRRWVAGESSEPEAPRR